MAVAITPSPWIPRVSAVTSRAIRNGSSPRVSKFRPACGTRTRFSIGAKITSWSRARESRPSTWPYWCARSALKVAASATGAGMAVVGRFIRTPAGPSVNVNAGMPSRGTPGMNPTPISRSVVGGGDTPSGQPLTIPSFSSSVIA